MKRFLITLLATAVLVCGCMASTFNPVIPQPAFTHHMTVNVMRLPGAMGLDALRLREARAQEIFKPVGIELFFKPPQEWAAPNGPVTREVANELHLITPHQDYTLWVVGELSIDGTPLGGWAWIGARTAIVATNSCPTVVAHELGHCLGLEHVNKAFNLMSGYGYCEDVLTEDQAATMRRNIR